MRPYLVVIGDVISSREVSQRQKLQETLKDTFQELNLLGKGNSLEPRGKSAKSILSPYTLTLGDEFQAVYTAADVIFRDSLCILENVHPQQVRFSYGIGAIDTDINRDQAIGMDGEAFHHAREGIEDLKSERVEYQFSVNGIGDENINQLFNHTLRLFSNLLQDWHKNRLIVLRERLDGTAVREIARHLDITKTAVYRNIYAGNIREIMDILHSITDRMNHELRVS